MSAVASSWQSIISTSIRSRPFNDTLGHPTGDELLKAVAERLCVAAGDRHRCAARGDEFAVIQTGLNDVSDAASLAQRIRDALKAPYTLNGQLVNIDASIGIASSPGDGTDADQLLKNADMASTAPKPTPGCIAFQPAMDARIKARRALELDMRKAVTGGDSRCTTSRSSTSKATGSAGARRCWLAASRTRLRLAGRFHSDRGGDGPDRVRSANGMRRACADAATWPDDLRIAVNISRCNSSRQNIVPVVMNALAASGLPAHRLELEITEAVFLPEQSGPRARHCISLRELGVRIAMDDFAYGYSSLSYLRSFPFDKIKIDRSFIGDLSDTDDSIAIVRAITNLANNLT